MHPNVPATLNRPIQMHPMWKILKVQSEYCVEWYIVAFNLTYSLFLRFAEHISLEEISSDSNDELNKPKKVKKNASKSMKKTATSAATAKATSTAKSTEQNAPATGANGKPEGNWFCDLPNLSSSTIFPLITILQAKSSIQFWNCSSCKREPERFALSWLWSR